MYDISKTNRLETTKIVYMEKVELTDMLEDTQHQHQVKRYLMNGWEHLFHFTQDGNTEIDLEQVEFHMDGQLIHDTRQQ